MLAQRGPILACKKCDGFLCDRAQMEVHHQGSHIPKKKVTYLCGACGTRYFRQDTLVAHLGRRHPGTEPAYLTQGSGQPWVLRKRHAKELSKEDSMAHYRQSAKTILSDVPDTPDASDVPGVMKIPDSSDVTPATGAPDAMKMPE